MIYYNVVWNLSWTLQFSILTPSFRITPILFNIAFDIHFFWYLGANFAIQKNGKQFVAWQKHISSVVLTICAWPCLTKITDVWEPMNSESLGFFSKEGCYIPRGTPETGSAFNDWAREKLHKLGIYSKPQFKRKWQLLWHLGFN